MRRYPEGKNPRPKKDKEENVKHKNKVDSMTGKPMGGYGRYASNAWHAKEYFNEHGTYKGYTGSHDMMSQNYYDELNKDYDKRNLRGDYGGELDHIIDYQEYLENTDPAQYRSGRKYSNGVAFGATSMFPQNNYSQAANTAGTYGGVNPEGLTAAEATVGRVGKNKYRDASGQVWKQNKRTGDFTRRQGLFGPKVTQHKLQYADGVQNKQAPAMPEPQQAGAVQGGLVPVMRNGANMSGMSERDMMRADLIRQQAQQRAQNNYLQYFGKEQNMPMYGNGVRKYSAGGTVSGVGNVMGGVGGLMSLYGGLSGDEEVAKWGTAVSGVGSAVSSTGGAMQQQEANKAKTNATTTTETDGDSIKKSMPAPETPTVAPTPKAPETTTDMEGTEMQMTQEERLQMEKERRLRGFRRGRNGSAGLMAKYGCYMKGDANGRVKKR